MMTFAHSPQCADAMRLAIDEIFGDIGKLPEDLRIAAESEGCQSVFHTWFMFDRPIAEDGHLLVDLFLRDDSLGLSRGQRRYLEGMRASYLRPYEVCEVHLDSALVLRDLWDGVIIRIRERIATRYAQPGSTIFARLIEGPQGEREMHGVLSFPQAAMKELLGHVRLMHRAMRERDPGLCDRDFFKSMTPWMQRSWLNSFRTPTRTPRKSSATKKPMPGHRVLQLKIALLDVRPQVWRRLLVPERITLATLSKAIERVMGWESYHLHEFEIGGISYGIPDPEYPSDVRNEHGRRLADFDLAKDSRFVYRYDFGDSWDHRVVVEKILDPQPGARYPVCVEGRRACPPEDVGGAGGYAEFRRVLRSPQHEDHAHFRQWSRRNRRDFDPDLFDIDAANAGLHARILVPG